MNKVDPYSPMLAPPGQAPPLVMSLVVEPRRDEMVGGVLASSQRREYYVLLSALPDELRQRVTVAIQALQATL